jgi:hypothetical protein
MRESGPFSFGEFKSLSAEHQAALKCLLEQYLGHNVYHMEQGLIEDDLALWGPCKEGFCLPERGLEKVDCLGRKFEVLMEAAVLMVKSSVKWFTWNIVVDARNPLSVNVVLLETEAPVSLVVWNEFNAYKVQYFSYLALATAIVALRDEITEHLSVIKEAKARHFSEAAKSCGWMVLVRRLKFAQGSLASTSHRWRQRSMALLKK